MSLKNDFFHIKETNIESEQSICFVVEINQRHKVFEGHFPSRPIVPGVFTLSMIKECVSEYLGRNIVLGKIKECKFVGVLIPKNGLTVELHCTLSATDKLSCIVKSEESVVLKLKSEII